LCDLYGGLPRFLALRFQVLPAGMGDRMERIAQTGKPSVPNGVKERLTMAMPDMMNLCRYSGFMPTRQQRIWQVNAVFPAQAQEIVMTAA
jgi:hypothetical protein